MNNKPTLVILAAGIGRRFGGLKQLEPLGPDGSTIMEYTIYDAKKAGFQKAVLIVRDETEEEFRNTIGNRIGDAFPITYVHQKLDVGINLPDDITNTISEVGTRSKPWGTGHAVLTAKGEVSGPFAVVNADDYYGATAIHAIGQFLAANANNSDKASFAMVGYPLRNTLPAQGTVSRGICKSAVNGTLEHIDETHNIEQIGNDAQTKTDTAKLRPIPGDTIVSMNLWGFTKEAFGILETGFARFLAESDLTNEPEFYLPTAIVQAIKEGIAHVQVLPKGDRWCGVTNPNDTDSVMETLAALVQQGQYPHRLW